MCPGQNAGKREESKPGSQVSFGVMIGRGRGAFNRASLPAWERDVIEIQVQG